MSKRTHYTPAAYVIRVFGGVRLLARRLDKAPSTVCRWTRPRSEGGCEGRIPGGNTQSRILALALSDGIDIVAADLIAGRDV